MGYFDVANSPLLYVLVTAGVLYIVGLSAVFLRKSWRRCLELGISKEKLSAVARSSAVFTIVPSVSIVIGLFTLSTVLGIPWPWYRLSVVGSVSYELMAADMVADGMGYGSVGEMAAQADHTVFGAVMFVMSICILAGIIINIFAVEKIQTGMSTLKKKAGRLGHHRQLLLLPGDRGRLHAADLRLRNSLRPDLPHQHGSGGPVRFVHEALSSQVAGELHHVHLSDRQHGRVRPAGTDILKGGSFSHEAV